MGLPDKQGRYRTGTEHQFLELFPEQKLFGCLIPGAKSGGCYQFFPKQVYNCRDDSQSLRKTRRFL